MKLIIRVFAVLALFALSGPASYAQGLTGAKAQKSAQEYALLAYENALMAGGLEAARPHMTPDKFDELNGMLKNFGEDGFKQFLDRMRGGARDMARRKQIEMQELKGD